MLVHRSARTIAVAWIVLIWGAAAFLLVEGWTRLDIRMTAHRNELLMAEVERRVGMTAGFDESLWETPWWEYRKNALLETTWRGRVCRVETNSRGFRSADVKLPKPPGTCRIACVGASTTIEGWTNDTTYPAVVQRRLRTEFATDRIEVVNCGISSLTSQSELKKLPDYLALEPDLVVEYNGINDVSEIVARVLKASPRRLRLLRRSEFLARVLNRWLVPPSALIEQEMRERVRPNLSALAEQSAQAGVEVVFCSFAVPHPALITRAERIFLDYSIRLDWQGEFIGLRAYVEWIGVYNRLLREMCHEHGWRYIPVAEEMPGEFQYYTDFCHMTDKGIEKKAEIIAAHLSEPVGTRLSRARSAAGTPRGDGPG
jgi:lysophospholipase L1-like esterase